jgi:hypothetical protein
MGLVASDCQSSILRMLIGPEASKAHRRGVHRRLDPTLELLVQSRDGIGGAARSSTGSAEAV